MFSGGKHMHMVQEPPGSGFRTLTRNGNTDVQFPFVLLIQFVIVFIVIDRKPFERHAQLKKSIEKATFNVVEACLDRPYLFG